MEQNNQQEYILRIEGLHKRFGDTEILKGVNLNIRQGETHVICGPSGSGKSTTLYCINGLEKPTEGKIWFKDELITHKNLRQIRTHIGMVFQHFNLFPNMTVKENIKLAPVRLQKWTKEEADEKAVELLKRVGLEDKADTYPNKLSGGQKQRVAIARALVNRPSILLADEPTGNLDPKNSWEIMKLLEQINENGTTVLVVTHNREIVNAMQKRVVTMKKGIIVSDEEKGVYIDED